MRKDVIRVGDTVKIINPDFFLRCGYPLSLQDGMDMILNDEEAMKALGKGIDKAIGREYTVPLKDEIVGLSSIMRPTKTSYDILKIIRILAYYRISNMKFGGKERKIFTVRKEEAKGHEFEVISKRVVNTGIYVPASGGYNSWGDDYDYDPAYLNNAKSHVILDLMNGSCDGDYYYVGDLIESNLRIEKCNVEKVIKETNKSKKQRYTETA